jgi:hypothetical protein
VSGYPPPAVPFEAFHQGFGYRFAEVDHQQVLADGVAPSLESK